MNKLTGRLFTLAIPLALVGLVAAWVITAAEREGTGLVD